MFRQTSFLLLIINFLPNVFTEDDVKYVPTIVGGTNAYLGDYPHMAALGFEGDDNILWLCGGSLISNRYVLTAAHCTTNAQFGTVKYVRLGTIALDRPNLSDFEVIEITNHPDYNPPQNYNDIALLKLSKDVPTSRYVKPARLYSEKNIPLLYKLKATGWGLTEFGGAASNILQQVNLELFTLEECREHFKPSKRKLSQGILDSTQLCAGGRNEEKDTCQGDSGGPLQFTNFYTELHFIVGVTSFGKTCGSENVPGVYSRVSAYKPWIENVMKS